MENGYFVLILAMVFAPIYIWGFRALPQEKWQIICSVPIKKLADGNWRGLNLTYYGLFIATALSIAVALVVVLAGAAGINFFIFALIVTILIGICLPAARLIAWWIEDKKYSFSVGAASFIGIIFGPWLIWIIQFIFAKWFGKSFPPMAVIAAAIIGYTLGEGMGRLACISFGCCYGKPIDQMPKIARRYLAWAVFTFNGKTKKIAYVHQLDGQKIFAVQAVTAVLYTTGALAGAYLYLYGYYKWVFLLCITVTQGWRFCSEFFRADFRGYQTITAYQIMSLLTIPYAAFILWFFPAPAAIPDLKTGLIYFWNPSVILFIQALWLTVFISTARSDVTGSTLSFHVHQHKI